MNNYKDLVDKKSKLAVIGLGYVGLPIAVEFSKYVDVVGFDLNKAKIESYINGNDVTKEIGDEGLRDSNVVFTFLEEDISSASFYIVAVPTPVNENKTPDLSPLVSASIIVGKHLKKGDIVVYESTVYPGATEEECVPLLEKYSGLAFNKDFFVGYSPERINPGDKEHRLSSIKKIVSASNQEALDIVAKVYSLVVKAGVHMVSSIKVAEAAKVIENSQRDINIAFMNELSIIFHKMNIDTKEVLEAAGTKWNFLKFYPGLVGGHCIGVDPYYLTYKAQQVGYNSQVILSGRRINDGMGKYIADESVKLLVKNIQKSLDKINCYIFGMTFKENCPDARNSKVFDIYNELKGFGINPKVIDNVTANEEVKRTYGFDLYDGDISKADIIIVAVAHNEYKRLTQNDFDKMFDNNKKKILIDVKGVYEPNYFDKNYIYWRL